MSDALVYNICGVEMNSDVPDANGVRWTARRLEESLEVRQSRGYPTGVSGSALLADDDGSLTLVANGWVFAPSQEAAWLAYEQLAVMPGKGASSQIDVFEPVPKRWLVRRGDEPKRDKPAGGKFQYQLTFIADFPYKTALSPTSASIGAGGSVSVTNNGTAPAFVSVTATSAGSVRVRQNSSGQVLRTRASVASGTVFDAQSRTVRSSGGVAIYGVMDSPSEWLSIPRGATVSLTNEGSASVSVSFFDTYA